MTQIAKSLCSRDNPDLATQVADELECLNWFVWHDNVFRALRALEAVEIDLRTSKRLARRALPVSYLRRTGSPAAPVKVSSGFARCSPTTGRRATRWIWRGGMLPRRSPDLTTLVGHPCLCLLDSDRESVYTNAGLESTGRLRGEPGDQRGREASPDRRALPMFILRIRIWWAATILVTAALVVLATGVLVASGQEAPAGAQRGEPQLAASGSRQVDAPPADLSLANTGGVVTKVNVVTETNAQSTNSTTFVNLPGGNTGVSVPIGESALILARFSAESACSGGTGAQWCSVRILIGGVEANPVVGLDFAFDSTNNGSETPFSWESHSVDRSRIVGPGTYTVQVQWAVTSSATAFRLDDWSLTVERAQRVP
jgi:hypothetical protein